LQIDVYCRALTRVAVVLGLLFGNLAPGIGAAATAKAATHTVTIDGTRFQPDVLAVRPGDTVVWVNKDPFPHTVTSQSGRFDSQEIQPGKSWKYAARTKGDFAYVCTLHPTMRATLRVK
jgi:plastocyanin